MNFLLLLFLYLIVLSCSSIRKAKEIEEGEYIVYKTFKKDSAAIGLDKGTKVYLEDYTEFILLYPQDSIKKDPLKISVSETNYLPLKLRQNSFDLDLFVIPFKVRPPQNDVPLQLNTNFNTSAYIGFRRDILKITSEEQRFNTHKRKVLRNGFGAGVFTGLGSTAINPSVTSGRVPLEYDGLVVSYGISSIIAVEKFNAGLALGCDYLTNKHRKEWIYQQKWWIGVLVGLNLN